MQTRLAFTCSFGRSMLILGFAMNMAVLQNSAMAQGRGLTPKSSRDRVCDVVILSDGARLSGIALSDSPARFVLRTSRLKADAPELFANEVSPSLITQRSSQNEIVINTLRQRIDKLKIDAPDDLQQVGLLEEVIERLKPDEQNLPEFIVLEIEPKRLKKLETLAPNRRELATLALLNHMDDFENLHWKTVAARLQEIPAVQLKRPTPATQATPPEFTAERILAAVDVRLNKATRLIRTGETFVAEDAKPDMAVLMSSLLVDSLNNTLQELLNETLSTLSIKGLTSDCKQYLNSTIGTKYWGYFQFSAPGRSDVEPTVAARLPNIMFANGYTSRYASAFQLPGFYVRAYNPGENTIYWRPGDEGILRPGGWLLANVLHEILHSFGLTDGQLMARDVFDLENELDSDSITKRLQEKCFN